MLVLSRKSGERIHLGDDITIVVNKISGNRVSIGIDAPHEVQIVRGELPRFASVPVPAESNQPFEFDDEPVGAFSLPPR